MHIWLAVALIFGMSQHAMALKIEFRYDYDASGFFQQEGAKEALETAAGFFESMINDSLLGINPAVHGGSWSARISNIQHPFSGQIVSIPQLVVPEDTLVIFVGASSDIPRGAVGGPGGYQSHGGSSPDWNQRIAARGQAGALATPATDFGPWGGMISFSAGANWDFALDSNNPPKVSFISAAVHEISHVLGFGTCPSWNSRHDGAFFHGANAMASFGGPVPLEQTDPLRAHWREDFGCSYPLGYTPDKPENVLSRAFGGFGTPHGVKQIALMDPVTCIAGDYVKVLTDLDLAGLADIGWELNHAHHLAITPDGDGSTPELRWRSSSLFDYRVEFSTTLAAGSWQTVHQVSGDGTEMVFTPATGGSPQGFFRMEVVPREPAAAAALESEQAGGGKVLAAAQAPASESMPVNVTSCSCHAGE